MSHNNIPPVPKWTAAQKYEAADFSGVLRERNMISFRYDKLNTPPLFPRKVNRRSKRQGEETKNTERTVRMTFLRDIIIIQPLYLSL